MDWGLLLSYVFIFGARVVDVTLGTLRLMMVFRGRRLPAAAIGFFEVTIYIVALGMVVQRLDNPVNLVLYGLGFAAGNYLGSYLEGRLAPGYVTALAMPHESFDPGLADRMRAAGFGVTELTGSGRAGERQLLVISTERRRFPEARTLIEASDGAAFLCLMETQRVVRGVFNRRKGK